MPKGPDKTTMEGMIYHANEILQEALGPHILGIPNNLFQECKGLAILSVVEVGLVFSGSTGTGIMIQKLPQQEGQEAPTWSPPCAVRMTGAGYGVMVGASVKHILCFFMDAETIEKVLTGEVKMNAETELTIGWGRAAAHTFGPTPKSGMVPVMFSKGAFAELGIKDVILMTELKANKRFYGRDISPVDILAGKAEVPGDKVTMMPEVYEKLNGPLSEGAAVEKPTDEEEAKKSQAESAAASAAVEANQDEEVVEVDAAVEAAKETEVTKAEG